MEFSSIGRTIRIFRNGRRLRAVWLSTAGLFAALGTALGLPAPNDPPIASWSPGQLGAWSDVQPESKPFNLILISLDTTRKDRLSCYGNAKATTPNLDQLASEGILFTDPFTPAPITLPAHASMLTGLYPFEHGVRHNGCYVMSDDQVSLAELLKKHGYETGAVIGAFVLDHRFGLGQGFDYYEDRMSAGSARQGDTAQRLAPEVTKLSLAWIDGRKDRPFFLWAHYFDPHAPYHPPEPFKSQFADEPYSGEIAFMDSSIGDLISGLRSRGLLERTIILVAGDHGEGLGDHHEGTHSIFLYVSTVRIPMLMRLPKAGAFSADTWRGHKVSGLVSLVDLFPTAWNALGLPRTELPPTAGRSLLAMVTGEDPGHPWLYQETLVPQIDYGATDLRALIKDGWTYMRSPKPELYNLAKDPQESTNLADKDKSRLRSMETDLTAILREEKTSARSAMDQETVEKLKSLGYLGGAAANAGPVVDPKDLTGLPKGIIRAQVLAEQHRPMEAVALLDSLLKVHPRSRMAQRSRAQYLTRMGRATDAIAAYEKALAECPECPDQKDFRIERAMAYSKAGKLDEALKQIQTLFIAYPKEQGLHLTEGEIYQAKGEYEKARQSFQAEATQFPSSAAPWVDLGAMELQRKRLVEAERAFRKAIEANDKDPDALVGLGEVLVKSGKAKEAGGYIDQALAEDPMHPGALFRKGYALQSTGKTDEAIKMYQACLIGDPNNPVTLFNLGNLYLGKGRTDDAVLCFQTSIKTGKAPQGSYANLGMAYAQTGKLKEAIDQWNTAISRDPNSPAVVEIRKNIRLAEQKMKSPPTKGK